jgi:Flp pilus assembly pilin Flp|tara:strand:+ start:1124 stop:1378 length:255 start_codon:yes stop_codon:yes gene_type:complete
MKSLTIVTNVSQQLAARLFSRGRTQADKQRGVSALEYIVLAAAIVIAVIAGAALLGGADGPITTTFQNIADELTGAEAEEGAPE